MSFTQMPAEQPPIKMSVGDMYSIAESMLSNSECPVFIENMGTENKTKWQIIIAYVSEVGRCGKARMTIEAQHNPSGKGKIDLFHNDTHIATATTRLNVGHAICSSKRSPADVFAPLLSSNFFMLIDKIQLRLNKKLELRNNTNYLIDMFESYTDKHTGNRCYGCPKNCKLGFVYSGDYIYPTIDGEQITEFKGASGNMVKTGRHKSFRFHKDGTEWFTDERLIDKARDVAKNCYYYKQR